MNNLNADKYSIPEWANKMEEIATQPDHGRIVRKDSPLEVTDILKISISILERKDVDIVDKEKILKGLRYIVSSREKRYNKLNPITRFFANLFGAGKIVEKEKQVVESLQSTFEPKIQAYKKTLRLVDHLAQQGFISADQNLKSRETLQKFHHVAQVMKPEDAARLSSIYETPQRKALFLNTLTAIGKTLAEQSAPMQGPIPVPAKPGAKPKEFESYEAVISPEGIFIQDPDVLIGQGGFKTITQARKLGDMSAPYIWGKVTEESAIEATKEEVALIKEFHQQGIRHVVSAYEISVETGAEAGKKVLVLAQVKEDASGGKIVKKCDVHKAVQFGKSVAEFLTDIHQRGYVHMDIKPDNTLLRMKKDGSGDIEKVVVIDFGTTVNVTKEGAKNFKGYSRVYAPPESIFRHTFESRYTVENTKPAPSYDCFCLGVSLFECIVGKPKILTPDNDIFDMNLVRDQTTLNASFDQLRRLITLSPEEAEQEIAKLNVEKEAVNAQLPSQPTPPRSVPAATAESAARETEGETAMASRSEAADAGATMIATPAPVAVESSEAGATMIATPTPVTGESPAEGTTSGPRIGGPRMDLEAQTAKVAAEDRLRDQIHSIEYRLEVLNRLKGQSTEDRQKAIRILNIAHGLMAFNPTERMNAGDAAQALAAV